MDRFSRRNRTDIVFKGCGGLTDAFDDQIKSLHRINDDEYDYICETATDEELDVFLINKETITGIKEAIKFVNDKLVEFNSLEEE